MTSLGDRHYVDEPALSFEKTKLSPQKELVRLFYKEMWDHADKSLIPTICEFSHSLGSTTDRRPSSVTKPFSRPLSRKPAFAETIVIEYAAQSATGNFFPAELRTRRYQNQI
jgi:hypothetical protein